MNLTQIMLDSKLPLRELTEDESRKLKETLLSIYKDILLVCNENTLTCYLGGGSCLGAVRHNGFIPWDDDLDLNMFREEYDLLPSLLEKKFPGKYKIIGPGFTKNNPYNFIKIEKIGTKLKTVFEVENENHGIGIDVFPMESIPKNPIVNKLHGTILNGIFYIAICTKLFQKPSFADRVLESVPEGKRKLRIRKIVGFLFSYQSYSKWMEKGDKIASKKYNSDMMTIPSGRKHYFGEIQKKSVFSPPLKHLFEGIESNIPNGFDKYLSSLYGDYMQVPAPEKREKHFIMEIDFGESK